MALTARKPPAGRARGTAEYWDNLRELVEASRDLEAFEALGLDESDGWAVIRECETSGQASSFKHSLDPGPNGGKYESETAKAIAGGSRRIEATQDTAEKLVFARYIGPDSMVHEDNRTDDTDLTDDVEDVA